MDEPDNERVADCGLVPLRWPGRSGAVGPAVGGPGRAWGRNPGPLEAISLP